MFDILFGWRKASKCKNLIKRVQCRLKLLKNKRYSIIRLLREDMAQLLKNGHHQNAFSRVEQLFKDQSIMAAYDLLDHFCEFIITQLPYIRRHKDFPNDINEAVSSLIFASARCGDLPELPILRKLFGDRYGHKFAMAAVELFPGNLVNRQISEKLCIKSIPDDVKLKLLDEIARDYSLQMGPFETEDRFELQHQQVNRNSDCQWEDQVDEGDIQVQFNSTKEAQMQPSNGTEIQGKDRSVGSLSNCEKLVTEPCHSHSSLDITSTSTSASIVIQPPPNVVEPVIHKSPIKEENYDLLDPSYEPGMIPYIYSGQSNTESRSSSKLSTAFLHPKVEGITTSTASESSSQFHEKSVVYLDDVEEFESTILEDGNCKDQRLFMFKSTILPLKDNCGDGDLLDLYHDGCDEDRYESRDGRPHSRSSSKSRKSEGKGSKRRSVSQESQMYHSSISAALSAKDVECEMYYGESCDHSRNDSHRYHHRRKHHKKMTIEESQSSSFTSREKKHSSPLQPHYAQKTPKQLFFEEMRGKFQYSKSKYNQRKSCSCCSFNSDMTPNCCLEHPCYFCTSDDKDDWESQFWKQREGTTTLVGLPYRNIEREEWQDDFCHFRHSLNEEPLNSIACKKDNKAMSINTGDQEMGWNSPPHKPRRRSYENNSIMYDVVSSQNHRPNKLNKKAEEEAEEISECPASCPSSRGPCSRVTSPWAKKGVRPPYVRAVTMLPERSKDIHTDNILRSASCQFQRPNHLNIGSSSFSHVHPKLPDYDDLAAKFMALKKEHLQSKHPLAMA